MIILGVDPGFSFTGYSIATQEGNKLRLLDYGVLKLSPSKSLSERVAIFHDHMAERIVRHKVTAIALETSFLGKNAQSFLKLGYLRGILYLLAHKHNAMLFEYAPREVKMAVTGYGGAGKEQIKTLMSRMFPQLVVDKLDLTDAIAVTLCGLWKGPADMRLKQLSEQKAPRT